MCRSQALIVDVQSEILDAFLRARRSITFSLAEQKPAWHDIVALQN